MSASALSSRVGRCRGGATTMPLQLSVPLREAIEAGLGAREIVAGMRLVVDTQRLEVDIGYHRPQRLAQGARRLHGGKGAAQVVTDLALEIGIEQGCVLGCAESAVGGEIGEIEHRRAETAILPVDQPELPPVVDEVAGQEIVMTE